MGWEEEAAKAAGIDQNAAAVKSLTDNIVEFRRQLVEASIPRAEVTAYVLAYIAALFHAAQNQQNKGG